ncbi:hypothetical protein DPMN_108184 [Dreissena polymorpha]|uniref:Uncharacterized protein n=1 Tax=Dreissena polymorpha TaxID=45954 RepID=A0A9D4K8M3_DREPO|nr:hypothetical protein DPMN_108184 [Dreissena polymorpha]
MKQKATIIDTTISGSDWFDYFQGLFSTSTTTEPETNIFENIQYNADDTLLDLEISDDEITNSVESLRSGCASGIDGI